MFFVFFLLWVIFNSKLNWEIAIFGVIFSGALYAFCCAFLDYSPKKDAAAVRRIPKMIAYAGLLISEIVKSNVALIRIVLNPKIEIKPQLVKFRTPVTGRIAGNILADSITLTPGTITVLDEGDYLTVHCLDEGFMDGIDDTPFQKMLLTMQEEATQHDA